MQKRHLVLILNGEEIKNGHFSIFETLRYVTHELMTNVFIYADTPDGAYPVYDGGNKYDAERFVLEPDSGYTFVVTAEKPKS